MPKIIAIGKKIAVELEFQKAISIGRHIGNSLPLPDPEVSRHHAQVFPRQGEYVVHDLGSRNGILVNGEKQKEHILEKGDELIVGGTVLIYEADSGEHVADLLSPQAERALSGIDIPDQLDQAEVATFTPVEMNAIVKRWLNRETKPPMIPNRLCSDFMQFVLRADSHNHRGDICLDALQVLQNLFGGHRAVVLTPEAKKKSLDILAAIDLTSRNEEPNEMAVHKDILRVVLDAGKAVYSANCARDFRFKHLIKREENYLIQSFLAVPIYCAKNYYGLLYMDQPAGASKYDLRHLMQAYVVGQVLGKFMHWYQQGQLKD